MTNLRPDPDETELRAMRQRLLECPAYRSAYQDLELMQRDELRPIRLYLELVKPEIAQQAQKVRSTVVVFRPRTPTGETNGHQAPIDHDDKAVEQVNFAVDALSCDSNAWRSVGAVSGYTTSTTRLNGVGDPFAVPDGGFLLLVYRGVVDFEVDGGHAAGGPGAEADSSESVDAERGAVVGSQSLVVPQGHSLSLNAPRGATVVGLARAAAVLPIVAPQTSADDDPDGRPGDGGGTGPAV